MKKTIFYGLALSLIAGNIKAQEDVAPIKTGAANFLTIPADARHAGMGGAGVALTGGNNSVFYNGATALAGPARRGGATYTYAPWMRDYKSGFALHSLGASYKFDERNVLLAGIRYYNYPKVAVMEEGVETGKNIRPMELAAEVGYARELFSGFALSATFRYIHSDMGNIGGAKSAGAVAFDIGGLYTRKIYSLPGARWAAGFQVSNIGSKIKYVETKEELPAQAKVGGSVELPFAWVHSVTVAADLGHRFAPSDVESFGVNAGMEYSWKKHLMVRGGYHYGDKEKGDWSYATAGLGGNYRGIHLDFSWLFAEKECPFRNSFWFSAGLPF